MLEEGACIPLEYKDLTSSGGSDLLIAIEDLASALEEYRKTNDRRLEELERRGAADVVTTEKLARLDRVVDELSLKSRRPHLSGATPYDPGSEHKAAYESYVRKGQMAQLDYLEQKALSVGSEADGGYLVPDQTARTIGQSLRAASPIRSISGHIEISSSRYRRVLPTSAAAAGWVGESDPRPQTGTPGLTELAFPTMELYAMPAATIPLLDDAAVDIDSWLANEVRLAFAKQEGQAFVSGDGVNRPRGFLNYPTVAAGAWQWGSLGYVASGAAGAFPVDDPADCLIDLVYALKADYRANGRFVMSRLAQSAIRKLTDADGNYLWQPSLNAGIPSTLMGYPICECEEMPDLAPGSMSIAFGDFERGYLVVDRIGIRILRDPFVAKPYVLFYTTKRVGGGVQDFDAIKLLKFGAG